MRVGILGGGQLAQMLALAAAPLGVKVTVLDPSEDACAHTVADHIQAEFDDLEALHKLAERSDVVTFEFENVSAEMAQELAETTQVHPSPQVLSVAQDRLKEKQLFLELGIPTPAFHRVSDRSDLDKAIAEIGFPCVLKTSRDGYDGKGQAVLRNQADVDSAWLELGGKILILEAFIEFRREVSVVAVRSSESEVKAYALAENQHRRGMLAISMAPASVTETSSQAHQYAARILEHFNYVGVLAVEFFETKQGLLINEMAPRVHNSGHWTQNGAETSQFENHIRAILGWPLGDTRSRGMNAMVNWIGVLPKPQHLLGIEGLHWHDYGKKPRAGRKVGHVNLCAKDLASLQAKLSAIGRVLSSQLKEDGLDAFNLEPK
ncbi:MAG: 5-(carboxyamino)imidazole ribonucleotide synthase [bacterium]